MKKTIIALFAVMATAFGAAANTAYSVWVNLVDSSKVEYRFDDEPVATLENEEVKLTLNMTGATVSYPMADIVNFTFSSAEVGVNEIDDAASPWFKVGKELFEAGNLGAGTRVSIYDLAGQLLLSAEADAAGNVAVPLANLDKGVYAVSAGRHAFKFTR